MFYKENRALFTDLYELTMSQGYFNYEMNDKATFDLFFRENPFNGGYSVACGISLALEYLKHFRFTDSDINYLKRKNLFKDEFLEFLSTIRFTGTVEGVLEGTIMFPYTPIIKITSSLIEAQLVETALLNIINYSTLIATKAARITHSAKGGKIVEFGLRRAQGDSAYIGVRAALVGGCVGTSFVKAGEIWDCQIAGTQAHSWVQAFPSEYDSFKAYANSFPKNCILLLDTYNVLKSGLPNAIQIAKYLRAQGKELQGVRIDSGDLAYLALEVYRTFSKEGFPNISIILSNELDEYTINSIVQHIKEQGNNNEYDKNICNETINHLIYGVGTRLITGGEQGALGGVYKLVAFNGIPRIKVSENPQKTINPGDKTVWRVSDSKGKFLADVIGLSHENPIEAGDTIFHPIDPLKKFVIPPNVTIEPLYQKIMENGRITLKETIFSWKNGQKNFISQFRKLDPTFKRLLNPHIYKVSLSKKLFQLKMNLIKKYSPDDIKENHQNLISN